MQPWPCFINQLRTIPYMDAMHAEWLRQYAEEADRILEWGCGGSTIWLAQIAKGKLFSVEHDPEWRQKVDSVVVHLESVIPLATWIIDLRTEREEYCGKGRRFLPRDFDLAFIDGYAPWRLDCLEACKKCVKPGGHIFMHDSQRYTSELFKFIGSNCKRSETRVDSIGVGMWHGQLKE